MKNTTTFLTVLIAFLTLTFTSCGGSDEIIPDNLKGNKYQIKVDGKVYDEGQNLFAGITTDLTDENTIQAGLATTLAILFERSNYVAGKKLMVGLENTPNVSAYATGVLTLNKDTANQDIFSYVALSGTTTIISKNRIEFELTCYRLSDLNIDAVPVSGATPFIISGYVTENNPK